MYLYMYINLLHPNLSDCRNLWESTKIEQRQTKSKLSKPMITLVWRKKTTHTHTQINKFLFYFFTHLTGSTQRFFFFNIQFSFENDFFYFRFRRNSIDFLCTARYVDTAWQFFMHSMINWDTHKRWKWLKYGKQKWYWFFFMAQWACGWVEVHSLSQNRWWSNRVNLFHWKSYGLSPFQYHFCRYNYMLMPLNDYIMLPMKSNGRIQIL